MKHHEPLRQACFQDARIIGGADHQEDYSRPTMPATSSSLAGSVHKAARSVAAPLPDRPGFIRPDFARIHAGLRTIVEGFRSVDSAFICLRGDRCRPSHGRTMRPIIVGGMEAEQIRRVYQQAGGGSLLGSKPASRKFSFGTLVGIKSEDLLKAGFTSLQ